MKTRLWTLLVAFVLALLPGGAALAEAPAAGTPAQAAASFFAALKARDLKTAAELCDVVVQSHTPYGFFESSDVPAEPEGLVRLVASHVTDSWILELKPDRIRVASGGRALDPRNFFKSDKTFYALADAGIDPKEWETFANNADMDLQAGYGYVLYLHQVNGRWLVFRIVENGVIGSVRD